MTKNTGKKTHKKKFKHLHRMGARLHRKDFIEVDYIKGVVGIDGSLVIRPLNLEEAEFLDKYYKETVHGTFVTDEESKMLFRKAKSLTMRKENIEFYESNGFYPEDVIEAIEKFNVKSKQLGNLLWSFWDQRDINSDDYKRRTDIHCNAVKGLQLESFDDIQYIENVDDEDNTYLEDLITESEE